MKLLPALLLFGCVTGLSLTRGAEVFEATMGREKELPGGKEADGIRGDFVLRTDRIEAVISQNAPNRRANMSTFYGPDGVTPGCLYDLTLRGANNDQLVIYGPGGHGLVSWVRALPTEDAGSAAVETVITAAKNNGIYERHVYTARDGWAGVFITTTLRNETAELQKVAMKEDLTKFNGIGEPLNGVRWVDAINPAHHAGYAVVALKHSGYEKMAPTLEIAAGGEIVIERFFAVGSSPAAAVGEGLRAKGMKLAK